MNIYIQKKIKLTTIFFYWHEIVVLSQKWGMLQFVLIKGKTNINENELSKIMKPNYKKNSMLNREIEKNYLKKKE